MSVDREMLERRTGRNFSQFTQDVLAGNALCRRALLFMFLRRTHHGIKFEDVDFAWDELEIQWSRSELIAQRQNALDTLNGDTLAAVLDQVDKQLETAHDDSGEVGKAKPPIAD